MKVIGVDYVDKTPVFTVYFSAPHRVDFRALVRDLAGRLGGRVELRQVGPRDEARLQGGIGPCGRDLCCATFLKDFEPVSVRMAKDQDLPVNPLRIAGACGRLMCCLKYEHPLYQDFHANAPRQGEQVETPEGPGVVTGHNVPGDKVVIKLTADGRKCACTRASVCGSRQGYEARYGDGPQSGAGPADAETELRGAVRRRHGVREPARRRVRRILPAVLVTVSLLAAACSASPGHDPTSHSATGTPAAAAPAGPQPDTLAGYYAQKLRWRPCNHGFQCARLLVPFDYHRPAWRRFSLPVIRLPATDPQARIGSLVVNPGGPGGSGVQYALGARTQVSAAVRARFDVVGFDPRGVGGSIPSIRCLTGPQLDKYFETSDTPVTAAQRATVVSQSKLFARGCEQHSGALLPYMGTANSARDMDVLRAALGEAKLTYLGKSYGTYLGTWYAQLFPSHVRALVLDGAVDPSEPAFSMNVSRLRAFKSRSRPLSVTACACSVPAGHTAGPWPPRPPGCRRC